jgi:hypothetical protein
MGVVRFALLGNHLQEENYEFFLRIVSITKGFGLLSCELFIFYRSIDSHRGIRLSERHYQILAFHRYK